MTIILERLIIHQMYAAFLLVLTAAVAPPQMTGISQATPAEMMQAGVNAAILSGESLYRAPPSSTPYLFYNNSLLVENANSFRLILGDNAVIFSVGAGVLVRDCVNVSLEGGLVSYHPSPSAQGMLDTAHTFPGKDSKGGDVIFTAGRVVLDERFPQPTSGSQCLLWGRNNTLSPSCWRCCLAVKCPSEPPNATAASPSSLRAPLPPPPPPQQQASNEVCIKTTGNFTAGTPVSWSNYRSGYTVSLVNCTRCRVLDTNIVAATFMAVTEFGGGGGNTYEGVNVGWYDGASKPYTPLVWKGGQVLQPRLSSNADVFHSYSARKGPTIRNCTFGNAADDFFNVHNEIQVAFTLNTSDSPGNQRTVNTISTASTASSSNVVSTLYLVDPHSPVSTDLDGNGAQAGKPRTCYGTINSLDYARPGDTINLTTPWKFEHVGDGKILSIARTSDPAVLKQAVHVYAEVCKRQDCAKGPPTFVYKVVLAGLLGEPDNVVGLSSPPSPSTSSSSSTSFSSSRIAALLAAGVDATVVEQSAAGAVVEGCTFAHTNANLGRWKSPHSKIVNNTFINARMCNLEVTALQTYLEGTTYIPNVTIADNVFVGYDDWCNSSSIHPGKMSEVQMYGNVFRQVL